MARRDGLHRRALFALLLCGASPGALADPGPSAQPAPPLLLRPPLLEIHQETFPGGSTGPLWFFAGDDVISEDQFYERAGRPDLVQRARRRRQLRTASRFSGGALGALALLTGSIGLPIGAQIDPSSPQRTQVLAGVGGACAALGALSITLFAVSAISPHPIQREEMEDLALRHNRGLGVPEGPVPEHTEPPGLPAAFQVVTLPAPLLSAVPVHGAMASQGGDLGTFQVALDACRSGEEHDFKGVDLFPRDTTHSRLRVVVDALHGGYSVAVPRPGATEPRVFTKEQCQRFDIQLERLNERINRSYPFTSSVELDCTYQGGPGEGRVQARAAFGACY